MQHSWIISAHVSMGALCKQLCMFNCQKALAQKLFIKLQQQLFASNFMFKTLLGEFSSIVNIYQSYDHIIQTSMQLLRNEPVMDTSITSAKQWPKRSLLPFLGYALHWLTGPLQRIQQNLKQKVNSLIQNQTQQQKTLVHVISISNITR